MISKKMFTAIVAVLVVLLAILIITFNNNVFTNKNQNLTVNPLVNTENEEWTTYLKEKGFALILAKTDNFNSEITEEEKAEFACLWAQSYDEENYINNTKKQEENFEFTYVEGKYLINVINDNFVSSASEKDYTDIFTNDYYIHPENLNLVYTFIPIIKSVNYNNVEDTYTLNFVTYKSNNGDKNLQNTISYDDYENENEYNLVVKKIANNVKIISIEKL